MSFVDLALQLPRIEKVKLMESLWDDLSRDEGEVESPDWHETALRETEKELKAGKESIVEWEEAKRQLRGDP